MSTLTIPALRDDRLREYTTPRESTVSLLADLDQTITVHDAWLNEVEDLYTQAVELADNGNDAGLIAVVLLWDAACERLSEYVKLMAMARQVTPRSFRHYFVREVGKRAERLAELMRTIAVVCDELELETPDELYEAVWTLRITPLAYLRAMWNVFWSSIRQPFSNTVVELKTGRVLATE